MLKPPSFLLSKPEPQIKTRLYNGRKLTVVEGKVRITSIQGWVDNPRIELAKKKLIERVGTRDITQEEILDLMKNDPDVKLKDLRDDILKNGLREPLTLSYNGRLLDGNRRFYAIKYALESLGATDPNKQDLEVVDAFVLMHDATEEDEQNVLVEENFTASLKIEWPDYVKAIRVVNAHEEGISESDIAKKYSWQKSKVRETLKIHEIITEFVQFATSEKNPEDESGGGLGLSEHEAEIMAAKSYQFFNEAQKSFFAPLKTDIDFKIQFFRWIAEGKFSSFLEVRIAYNAWKSPEIRSVIMEHAPLAAKSAKAMLDYKNRVVKGSDEATSRIESFIMFLHELKAAEIKQLPSATRVNLEKALALVVKMSNAASE